MYKTQINNNCFFYQIFSNWSRNTLNSKVEIYIHLLSLGRLNLSNIPNLYQADPIPEPARERVEELLLTGDLFR